MISSMRNFWMWAGFPFVAPLLLFACCLAIESLHPLVRLWGYPIQTLLVGGLLFLLKDRLPSLRPTCWIGSGLVGGVVFLLWIGLDPWLTDRANWVPYDPAPAGALAPVLIAFRWIGAALVVPVVEELFWRGFLMRWLIQDRFYLIPLGRYTHTSFIVTTAFFSSIHGPEWALAVPAGLLFGFWFVRTRSLGDVIAAHAICNALLGTWVIWRGAWNFW